MKVYGVDFTSAPSSRRPIVVAVGTLSGETLEVRDLVRFVSFEQFEDGLREPGPWIAGLDFPFGLPRRLLDDLRWPTGWETYVGRVAGYSRSQFEDLLQMYQGSRPRGDREHKRRTDREHGVPSPMRTVGAPLATMFFEGAPRLAAAPVSVLPCRPTEVDRVVVEARPALVARRILGRRSYKSSRRHRDQSRRDARRKVVSALTDGEIREGYGLRVSCGRFLVDGMVGDGRGDFVDAVLASIQAAWAWRRRSEGFGIPDQVEPAEGWIVDPGPGEGAEEDRG